MQKGESMVELIDALLAINDRSGVRSSVYVVEECAELVQVLMKDQRGKGDRERIISEACDVLLTVKMLLREYGVPEEEIQDQMRYKCRRAMERWEKSREV